MTRKFFFFWSLPKKPHFLRFQQGTNRVVELGAGIDHGLSALFFPFPLVQADHPRYWWWLAKGHNTELYFAGGLLTFAAWMALAFALARRALLPRDSREREELWLGVGAVAFVIALGSPGLLPNLRAKVDGKTIRVIKDDMGRMEIQLPQGWRNLSLRYVLRWQEGFWIAEALFFTAMTLLKYAKPRTLSGLSANH